MQDIFTGLIVIPNLIAIISLTKVVKKLMKQDKVNKMIKR